MPRVFGPGRLILATVVIGVLAGLGATGFHFVADRFGESLFAWAESQTAASRLPFVLLVPAIGIGLVGLVLQYYHPARLGGVREVFESIEHDGGIIPMQRIWNFGAIIKGYWSGLMMVADMSGAYHALLLPGIIAGGISFLLSWELNDEWVFGLPLHERPNTAVVAAR